MTSINSVPSIKGCYQATSQQVTCHPSPIISSRSRICCDEAPPPKQSRPANVLISVIIVVNHGVVHARSVGLILSINI